MRINSKYTGLVISWIIRGVCRTLRLEITDDAGLITPGIARPVLWTGWHNRMFMLPWMYQRWSGHMPCIILSSPSSDGQIIADTCAQFRLEAARGSSSRPEKGMSALIKLAAKVKAGYNVGITPDGPRGPCYHLNPGVLKLAQLTGAPIMPVHIRFEKCWQFKTWDHFILPMPFSRVRVTFDELVTIPRELDEADFEQMRLSVQGIMRSGADMQMPDVSPA